MDRRIITILQGTKYPAQYADTMAEFLQRFDVELWVFTDQDYTFNYARPVSTKEKGWPEGWWGKMMLYDPETTGLAGVLFCDVDTLFLKDPSPIFEWIEKVQPDAAYIQDFLPHPGYESRGYVSTSLFYLNPREKKTRFIYDWYRADVKNETLPRKTDMGLLYGDQEFVTDAFFDCDISINRRCFPMEFQAQHKALFWKHQSDRLMYGRVWRNVWRDVRRRYGDLTLDDFISITFMGTQNLHGACPQYEELMALLTKLDHPFLKLIREGVS